MARNKIKLEVTEAQLEAIVEITNECSSMIGSSGGQSDKDRARWIKQVDRLLYNNGYKRTFS